MSSPAVSVLPRSLKRLSAAVVACALLAFTPVVAPAGATQGGTHAPHQCDEKDLAKDKAKCDPYDGDGRKN